MIEQERINFIADRIRRSIDEAAGPYITIPMEAADWDLVARALDAHVRSGPADLREAIAAAIYGVSPRVYLNGTIVPWSDTPLNGASREKAIKAADAVLALLPQTQAASGTPGLLPGKETAP